jgi:hypothetical protein
MMSTEIHKPELARRVREGIASGQFQDFDDLLTKALDALAKSSIERASLDWSQCPCSASQQLFGNPLVGDAPMGCGNRCGIRSPCNQLW